MILLINNSTEGNKLSFIVELRTQLQKEVYANINTLPTSD